MKRLSLATWFPHLLSSSRMQKRKFALISQDRFQVCICFVLFLANSDFGLGFCSLIDRETLLNEIMPPIEDLVSDPSQHVRAALGTQISGLAPILGKEE